MASESIPTSLVYRQLVQKIVVSVVLTLFSLRVGIWCLLAHARAQWLLRLNQVCNPIFRHSFILCKNYVVLGRFHMSSDR